MENVGDRGVELQPDGWTGERRSRRNRLLADKSVGWLVTIATVILGLLVGWWILCNPVKQLALSIPGMDDRNKGTAYPARPVEIGSLFTQFREAPDIPGTMWPQFRGSESDNISKESIPLTGRWGNLESRILWRKTLGEGHAAPAVFHGKVYLLDYDEQEKADLLRCFLLSSGEELWRRGYKIHLKRNHGLSRTIPAVNEKYVVTVGPKGQVMCVDRANGNFRWGLDIAREYGSEIPFWYTGQCPLLDRDTVILATGGRALLAAIDCATGRKIWETPNPRNWKMSHSSVMPMNLNGKRMYVYAAIGGICGISAEGPDRGTILWENSSFAPTVIAPSPLVMDHGRILVTAGYGAGSALFQVSGSGEQFRADLVTQYKPQEGLASEQQTPLYVNGYIFGIQPKDAGELRNQFVCFHPSDCRQVLMSSGKSTRFGLGPYILADSKFFILNDDGEMTIAKVAPTSFTVLDKARIMDGQDSWGPICITGGYLLMRDSKQMICMDIKAE